MNRIMRFSEEYTLSASAVDEISDRIVSVCESFRLEARNVSRYRISFEECLLIWLEKLGEGAKVRLELNSRLGRPFLRLTVEGEMCNPYEEKSEDFGVGGKSMLMNVGIVPTYSYAGNQNTLTFNIRKESGHQIVVLLCIIAAAVAFGVAGRLLIPERILGFMVEDLITPIEDTFFRVLSCIAGPMIFLSVAWGVYGIGDIYTLGRVGKRLMLDFLSVVFLFSTAGALLFPFLGPALNNTSTQTSQFGRVLEMLLNIIPSDIFSPFLNNNTLQIIFLAFIIGLALIFLGQRTSSIAKAIEQINHIITFLMTFVSKLVPCFVFVVILQMIWSDSFGAFGSVWKFAIVFVCAYLLAHTAFTAFVAISHKINPLTLLKECLPSYLIAFTTASSSATFESNMSISQRKLGISNAFASFGIPFGMVMFKPSTALYYILFCFYLSKNYESSVQVSISWILIAVLITAVSAVATPPIPGGAAATYTILFSQLGIPASALGLALAVDIVFDFVLTSGDMYALLIELYHVSFKVGLRNDKAGTRKQ